MLTYASACGMPSRTGVRDVKETATPAVSTNTSSQYHVFADPEQAARLKGAPLQATCVDAETIVTTPVGGAAVVGCASAHPPKLARNGNRKAHSPSRISREYMNLNLSGIRGDGVNGNANGSRRQTSAASFRTRPTRSGFRQSPYACVGSAAIVAPGGRSRLSFRPGLLPIPAGVSSRDPREPRAESGSRPRSSRQSQEQAQQSPAGADRPSTCRRASW